MNNFEFHRAIGYQYEVAFSKWLQSRNYMILATYNFTGKESDKSPRLIGCDKQHVIPDILGCRNGLSAWFEVKYKDSVNLYRKNNIDVTGLPLRHYCDYQNVKKTSGLPVYIVFIHEREKIIKFDEIDVLNNKQSHVYSGSKMDRGGTVFFKFDKLTTLANIDVLAEFMEAKTI